MARTKASVGAKVSSGKSSKAAKVAPSIPSSSGSGTTERPSKSTGGGNPVCPRETPKWQRPITTFFVTKARDIGDDGAGTSKPKQKRPTMELSDEATIEAKVEEDETQNSPQNPKNTELDESIHLQPLTGENSHKLDEYYPKNGEKGKGVGKKTKGKENVSMNEKKRQRDEVLEENVSKKIKV